MTADSSTRRHPMSSLVSGLAFFALALWSAADGEFWWHGAIQVGIGLYFVGGYVFADSDRYGQVGMLLAGLLLALTPDLPWWLRVTGALMAVVGLFLTVRAIAPFRPAKHERSRGASFPT